MTHKSGFLILTLSLLCVICSGNPLLSLGEAVDLCRNIEHPRHGLFTPFICHTNKTNLGATGAKFQQQHNLKKSQLDPVILVPGLGGSSLEASLEKSSKPAWYCFRSSKWFRIWFSLGEIAVKSCWLDNLFVSYDPDTQYYNNTAGVEIRPVDFGGLGGIKYLDFEFGHPISATSVFAPIIESLLQAGYTAGKDIRGAPFDWRLPATSEQKLGWYQMLRQLIEDTYATNGDRPVHIISHSMGGPTTLYFLNSMTQEWKDKYVKTFIPIAGPWNGAATALRAVVSGDNFGLSILGYNLVSNVDFRQVSRQAGGIIELLPNANLWDPSFVFVSTPKRDYTIKDFPDLFVDMGSVATANVFKDVSNIVSELQPPNVTTYCIYGHGVPTEIRYKYPDGDFDKEPIIDDSNLGDGTVPLESLKSCAQWQGQQALPVEHKQYDQLTHVDIIKDDHVITYLLSIVTNKM